MAYAPRILVVDDDAAVRQLFDTILSQDGYYVTAVTSGREALSRFCDTAFELVVLDMSLSDMDGLRLLRNLRSESPVVKIIAMSGFMECFLRRVAIDAGADAALTKPISPQNLQQAVYRLIDPACSWRTQMAST